jgi:hypothetical protein
MKKLVVMFTFFLLLSGVALAEDENKQSESTKNVKKYVYNGRKGDSVNQIRFFPGKQICGVYKTCVNYEEKCSEDR